MKGHLRRFLLMVALVAVVSVSVSAGMTINAEEPTPPAGGIAASDLPSPAVAVPGGPGFFSQSATSCRPYAESYHFGFSGQALSNPGPADAYYVCPVSLPHGATINKVVWYYWDSSVSYDVTGWLHRAPLDGTSLLLMAEATSSGSQSAVRHMEDTVIANPTVDVQSYAYIIEVVLSPLSSTYFVSYRIDYQYGAYLPAVMKNSN